MFMSVMIWVWGGGGVLEQTSPQQYVVNVNPNSLFSHLQLTQLNVRVAPCSVLVEMNTASLCWHCGQRASLVRGSVGSAVTS
jgi:hypothetical protein